MRGLGLVAAGLLAACGEHAVLTGVDAATCVDCPDAACPTCPDAGCITGWPEVSTLPAVEASKAVPELAWEVALPTPPGVSVLVYVAIGGRVYVGAGSQIWVAEAATGKRIATLDTSGITHVARLAVSGDGATLYAMADRLYAFDTTSWTLKWRGDATGEAHAMAVSPDGNVFACVGTLLVAHAPDGTLRWQRELPTSDKCIGLLGVGDALLVQTVALGVQGRYRVQVLELEHGHGKFNLPFNVIVAIAGQGRLFALDGGPSRDAHRMQLWDACGRRTLDQDISPLSPRLILQDATLVASRYIGAERRAELSLFGIDGTLLSTSEPPCSPQVVLRDETMLCHAIADDTTSFFTKVALGTSEPMWRIEIANVNTPFYLTVSDDGAYILVAGYRLNGEALDGFLQVYRVAVPVEPMPSSAAVPYQSARAGRWIE